MAWADSSPKVRTLQERQSGQQSRDTHGVPATTARDTLGNGDTRNSGDSHHHGTVVNRGSHAGQRGDTHETEASAFARAAPALRALCEQCARYNRRMIESGPTSHVYFSQRLRLHHVDRGNEEAPPMPLVHGGRDHCRNWDWVARDLSRDYHVIAPDLRGHGDSQWMIGGSYNTVDHVYDIAQLLYQKKMTPATVIGHSPGASVSLLHAGLSTVGEFLAESPSAASARPGASQEGSLA